MLASGEAAEALAAVRREREIGLPLAVFVLAGARIAHVAAGDDRDSCPPDTIARLRAAPRGFVLTSFVFSGRMPPCCARACFAAGERTVLRRPSISSTAAVPISSFTRAGSSTPGNCTRISIVGAGRPYCCTDVSARPSSLMRLLMVSMARVTVSRFEGDQIGRLELHASSRWS